MESINLFLMSTGTNEEEMFFKKVLKKFEKEFGVEVCLTRASWNNAFSRLIKDFKRGKSPDVFQLGTTWVQTFAYLGFLARVPSFVLRPGLTDWLNDCCKFYDKWVAQPWTIDIRALMLKEKFLKSRGISISDIKNSGAFLNICRKLSMENKKGNISAQPYPFTIRREADLLHRFTSWHWAFGRSFPQLRNGTGEILRNSSCLKTLDYIFDLMKTGKLTKKEIKTHPYEIYLGFLNRDEYVFFHGAWEPRFEVDGDYKYELLPMPVGGSDYYYWAGGNVLAVSSQTQNRKLSWQLIKFLLKDNIMKRWIKICVSLPAFDCQFWNDFIHIPNIRMGYEQIVRSKSYPCNPLWSVIEKRMSVGISDYFWKRLIENQSKEQAYISLEKADIEINRLIDLNWQEKV